jgi:hypothetical protein
MARFANATGKFSERRCKQKSKAFVLVKHGRLLGNSKYDPRVLFKNSLADAYELKVKLFLCLAKHHAMKTCWGSGGIAPRILDLGTRWR